MYSVNITLGLRKVALQDGNNMVLYAYFNNVALPRVGYTVVFCNVINLVFAKSWSNWSLVIRALKYLTSSALLMSFCRKLIDSCICAVGLCQFIDISTTGSFNVTSFDTAPLQRFIIFLCWNGIIARDW